MTGLCMCGHSLADHYSSGIPACRVFLCQCPGYQTEAETRADTDQPALFPASLERAS